MQTVNIRLHGQAEQVSRKVEGKRYKIASITDKGCSKNENEDYILVKSGDTGLGPGLLLAVADGVGGLECGADASRTAAAGLEQWWNITLKALIYSDIENMHYLINESLSATLDKINMDIFELGIKTEKKMATTLSVIFILNDWYCIKHVGDSRIYLITKELRQLTEDHSLFNQLLKTCSTGNLKCSYNKLSNVLTRCMGIKPELELFEQTGTISDTQGVLLCSDGLYKLLSIIEIGRGIRGWCRNPEYMQQGLQLLVDKARRRGEKDDISAILMLVKSRPSGRLHRIMEHMTGRAPIC